MAGKIKRLSRSDGVSVSAPTPQSVTSTQVDFTLNNAATDTSITGFSMSNTLNRSAVFVIDVERQDAGNYYHEVFQASVYWDSDASAWVFGSTSSGDDSGVTFGMTAGGSLTYTSSNMTGGSYVGTGAIANIIKVNT